MILSILIATIPERSVQFEQLRSKLIKQIFDLIAQQPELGADEVEVLHHLSPRYLDGGNSIGENRQALLDKATGKYVCSIDDDEAVAPNYIEELIRLCKQGMDVCTFRSICKFDSYWTVINMSLDNATNEETHPRGIVQRTPWHICPVRRKLAIKEKFNALNHNEDFDWMQRVLKYVRSEAHTDIILTQYNHSEANSEADKILKHEAATNH